VVGHHVVQFPGDAGAFLQYRPAGLFQFGAFGLRGQLSAGAPPGGGALDCDGGGGDGDGGEGGFPTLPGREPQPGQGERPQPPQHGAAVAGPGHAERDQQRHQLYGSEGQAGDVLTGRWPGGRQPAGRQQRGG
jgi:hypothetical protein